MKNKAVLNLHRMSSLQLIAYALHVVSRMTGNSYFPSPNPTLSTVTAAVNALQTAYDNAQGAGPAQTAVLHQKRAALELLLTTLCHYVEDRANDPSNVLTGSEPIILSSGMSVKAASIKQKRGFTVAQGEFPGSVELTASFIPHGAHEWQYSADISNPAAWIDADPTTKAVTTISGLQNLRRYYFRHRAVLKSGPSPWEDPIALDVV